MLSLILTAALAASPASAGEPRPGGFADSDIEGVPGRVYRHPRGWVIEEACFSRFDGEGVVAILDEAWKKFDPDTPSSYGGCLSKYNPSWARHVAQTVAAGRVLIRCGQGKGCAATSSMHRYPGVHGPQGFTKTSTRGEKWETIGLEDVEGCRKGNRMSFSSILFHETLHAAGEPMVNPLAHDASWRSHDPSDRIYSAQAVCFEGPRSAYGTTGAQCAAVVSRGSSGASAAALCRDFPQ